MKASLAEELEKARENRKKEMQKNSERLQVDKDELR